MEPFNIICTFQIRFAVSNVPFSRIVVGAGMLALVGLLVLPGPATAASKGLPGSNADSLSAAAVAFHLRYGAAPNPPSAPARDRWLARDKVQHVVFSGLWTLSTQYLLVNKMDWSEGDALPASIGSGTAVGLTKELYDASQPAGRASGKDLVADAVGIGLAVGIIAL